MPIPQLTNSPRFWRKNRFEEKHRRLSKITKSLKSRKRKSWPLLKIGLILAAFLVLIGIIGAVALLAWYSRDLPNPNSLINRQIAESTKIYDRTGQTVLYEVHGDQNRTLIKLSELPDYIKWSTIVIEDQQFYQHNGINLRGTIRAIVENILHGDITGQGGSSITQQLVKNVILSNEKSFSRKFKEIILAYRVEQKFSKDEILQMYLNEIPYGSTIYGIEAASQHFFGKSAKNLTIAESALLAAMPQRPSYFSPYGSHMDALIERQRHIIDLLAQKKIITQGQAEDAKNQKLAFKPQNENIIAPHFVMYVKDVLEQEYGITDVESSGMKIYTTLDLYKQQIAEEAVKNGAANNAKYRANNAALVAVDPKTGQILAMVGSKDYFGESEPAGCVSGKNCKFEPQDNVALRPRQPGSSIKPLVYSTAFEEGLTPETVLFDLNTTFKTDSKDYTPHDYDNKERGPVTVRKALAGSLNIPAVKTIYLTGIDKVIDQAEKMGYTTFKDRSRFGLSLTLGGGEVTLLEHTNAFGVFAREGIYNPTTPILKIVDKNGKVLQEFHDQSKQVLSQKSAQDINSILSDDSARAYMFGAGSKLTLGSRPVAAKTGTTNDNRDCWTIGYTPSLVAGVWAGNNDNSSMDAAAAGVKATAPIWNEFMKKVLGNTPAEQFKQPPANDSQKDILKGNFQAEVNLKVDRITGNLATDSTPPDLVEEKSFKVVHNELFWITPGDPAGPAPVKPEDDPNFASWEAPVAKWAKDNGYAVATPVQTDTGLGQNILNVSIVSPADKTTITDKNVLINVSVPAGQNATTVDYFIDDSQVAEVTPPFNYTLDASFYGNGWHTLKAFASDSSKNYGVSQIDFNLMLAEQLPQVNWVNPPDKSILYPFNFPFTMTAQLNYFENCGKLEVYFEDSAGKQTPINTITSFPSSSVPIKWDAAPAKGNYKLIAIPYNLKGVKGSSSIVSITENEQ